MSALVAANVSVDGIVYEWSALGVAEGLGLVLFLAGALRWRARGAGALAAGFGLLLVALVYREVTLAGLVEVNYWPGAGELDGYAYDLPAFRWWEPVAWWGRVVAQLGGSLLVAAGFLAAARSLQMKGGRA